jgi:hypothetical protein
MYTEWPAYAAFQERRQGRLAPGYYADFTVLSRELDDRNPQAILETQVLFTIVDGKVVYSRR